MDHHRLGRRAQEQAIEDGDSDLLILVMKTHPLDEEVQSRGSTGIVNMSREDGEAGAVPGGGHHAWLSRA